MSVDLTSLAWPDNRVGEACLALGQEAGIKSADARFPQGDLEAACAALGIEAQRRDLTAGKLASQLDELAPGIVQAPGGGYWALCHSSPKSAFLLGPTYRKHRVDVTAFEEELLAPLAAKCLPDVSAIAQTCGLSGATSKAVRVLLREQLSGAVLARAWELELPPGASFAAQLRGAGVFRRIRRLFGAHLLEYAALIVAWYAVGQGALTGRVDQGWLLGAALLMAFAIPLRLFTTWTQGWIALGAGGLLRQRLLAGAMTMDADRMRREGAGQLMGRVLETESLEDLALGGGSLAALSVLELILAVVIMAFGAAPALGPLALLIWVALTAGIAIRYLRLRRNWSRWRLHLTHGLVERMTGHRTRLAQEPPEKWHINEDREMELYIKQSAEIDRWAARLTALAPRGWLAVGVLILTPYFLGADPGSDALAVSLGGLLLAQMALKRAGLGAVQLAGAWISWENLAPMFESASGIARRPPAPALETGDDPVLEAVNLSYRYPDQNQAALESCNLTISRGDFLLLEGSSGSGKSTLVSVLAGMRDANGLLLASGLDRPTLGQQSWRKRIAVAPQYHHNHIMAASLAFNLLLGRAWPPAAEDLGEAWEVCQELGLGGLLERMPEGLQQTVGETGWQLSQGERSRVFLARALLQTSTSMGGLVILDESFAALDPETLGQCLQCALKRAPSLLVVAHP